MSLLKCTECGNEVSSKAPICPNCGAPIKKKRKVGCFGAIIIVIVVLIFFGQISNYFDERAKEQKRREDTRIAAQIEQERTDEKKIEEQKQAKEKAIFEASIENHYKNLISASKANNKDEITKSLEPFITFNRTDYKDVGEIRKIIEINNLAERARALPVSKTYENLEIYEKLSNLDPSNSLYKKKVAYYSSEYEKLIKKEARERQKANSDLELLNWRWSTGHGYVTAEGQVKNISGRKLERVQALVTWYDSNGNMITSDDSLIEYDPIMPGQVSPFKVMERYNPKMKTANIEFKFMWGNRISTYNEKN